MPPAPVSPPEPEALAPPTEGQVPKETPLSDVVTPPNTTVVTDGHHDDHSNAGLWALSGDHRLSAQLGTEGRIDGLATTFNLKAMADLESRTQRELGDIKHLIAKEGDATRHCIMQQEIDRLRSDNVKLEFRIK